MKIAVIGAGMAGLAMSWYLLQKNHTVTIFDRGDGASQASTGLLHPFPGRQAKLSWQAHEGMKATLELLNVAGADTFVQNGILRFAADQAQRSAFTEDSRQWLALAAPEKVKWIPEGITVFSRKYLEGLRRACASAAFVQGRVGLQDLSDFDAIIIAAGAGTLDFEECKQLGLKCNIGQMLICQWEEKIPFSLLGLGHITPTENPALCMVGSTYEHTSLPDREKALQLLEKVAVFYPPARSFKIVEVRSGVRIAPQEGYRPVVAKVRDNVWAFSGFGSRGLLYHALLAKSFVETENLSA